MLYHFDLTYVGKNVKAYTKYVQIHSVVFWLTIICTIYSTFISVVSIYLFLKLN